MSTSMDPASIASNALGTVLGYIGAEAATSATFTRLLWPQRAYAHMRVGDMIKMALLLPAGGPLYKACLEVLDGAARNGLLQGKAQGHMLGSAFFPNEDGTYTQHCVDEKKHEEASRNNLWSRVMTLIPLPDFGDRPTDTEKGSIVMPKIVRGRVAVHQLTLHVEPCDGRAERASNACAPTDAETGFPKIEAFYGILVTELSAIVLSVIIGTVWHSWFALLWLCPVALKLLSAACALSRDPLHLKSDSEPSEPSECFEVHMPAETGRFLIITSPPSLVTQFFRHYGHPQRDRSREVLQLAIVVAFALLFPIGLLCSVVWMPNGVQYVWLSYEMYLVCAMYVARYMRVDVWASTEQAIARALDGDKNHDGILLWRDSMSGNAVRATLHTNVFGRYGEGRDRAKSLISRQTFQQRCIS